MINFTGKASRSLPSVLSTIPRRHQVHIVEPAMSLLLKNKTSLSTTVHVNVLRQPLSLIVHLCSRHPLDILSYTIEVFANVPITETY